MLWRDFKVWQVYGANTDVGKTIISTILCKAFQRRAPNGVLYLKPVSTGPQDEADDRHLSRHAPGVVSKCTIQYSKAVSPHLAAQLDSRVIDDGTIVRKVQRELARQANQGSRFALLETAGGVLSPGPSGSMQADIYRPLRLPSLLVGDSKLGGIATTISSFESLHVRGYDVDALLLFDDPKWSNFEYLSEHFAKHGVHARSLPLPPTRRDNPQDDGQAMSDYYQECAESAGLSQLLDMLNKKHFARVSKLASLPSHADSVIWHPFRQHGIPANIVAIDSAYGDHFQVYNQEGDPSISNPSAARSSSLTPIAPTTSQPMTTPLFDASASWWTQGLGHGNADLSLAAAHAAGRYGHVMFAHAVHEPALDLSYNLLSTLQNHRLSRVFFTDNGSTGMEVAVKMALRASCQRYGWHKDDNEHPVGILGLKGSYHGDTIGVMNCSEPSTFNDKVDWYQPWGYWFDPPSVLMKDGQWHITIPSSMSPSDEHSTLSFSALSDIFDFSGREQDMAFYKAFITKTLRRLCHAESRRFGALILEPLVMGAGGMIFVDPLFQRTLITTIRENPGLISPSHENRTDGNDLGLRSWSGLPFIADEVFTGLYRLGRSSSSSFLSDQAPDSAPVSNDIAPDISVHAKLLTGGLLPLALTTASDAIFNTFLSDSKTDALLHGHSYTAHPIGCSVANKALDTMVKLNERGNLWDKHRKSWTHHSDPATSEDNAQVTPDIWSFFSPTFLHTLSSHPTLEGCFALGTVLAMTMKSAAGSGYNSTATVSLQKRLLTQLDSEGAGVHARVLGDVLYVMTSLTTRPEIVRRLEKSLLRALEEDED